MFFTVIDMTANQLIQLKNRSPFSQLEIHLSDGASIRVEQPYHVATRRNSPTCVIYEDDERMRFLAFRNITDVITTSVNGSDRFSLQTRNFSGVFIATAGETDDDSVFFRFAAGELHGRGDCVGTF